MLESESSALPFGDSPSYVLKYTTYNVLCKPFAQALVHYITLETKMQVFFFRIFNTFLITSYIDFEYITL